LCTGARRPGQPGDDERTRSGVGLRSPGPVPGPAPVRRSPSMSRPIIAVTDTAVPDDSLERQLAEDEGATYRHWGGRADLAATLDGAQLVFTNFVQLGARELGRLSDGAVVVRYGIGVDNIDLGAAATAGITVSNVPDYGANVVADHASMLALMLVRRVQDF